jgi:hypothetical protein
VVPRFVIIVMLVTASAGVTLTRLGILGGEGVAAVPIPASTPFGTDDLAGAGDPSPARRRFIARVERTCVRTADRGRVAQAAYARRVAARPDAGELVMRFSVRRHARQYRALRALGAPPEDRLAYRRWLETLAARVRLEARYAPLLHAGRAAEAQAVGEQALTLEARGDMLGSRFGLRLCTAGEPGR